jgi:phage head maturation protease
MTNPRTEHGVRATCAPGSIELRSNQSGGRTMFGHFARFDNWYEVRSTREGHFVERVAPGTFAQAFGEKRSQLRVMWDHGQDPTVGQKPLGDIVELREDREGPYYEVDLFDAGYVNDLVPAIRSEQTGASWRFSVPDGGDEWDDNPRPSEYNPDGLPERTIRHANVFEFGPVVWGANPVASSGVRSGTDDFVEHLLNDPLFIARFTERAGLKVVERILSTPEGDETSTAATTDGRSDTETTDETADGQSEDHRQRIADALKRFRQHPRKDTANVE